MNCLDLRETGAKQVLLFVCFFFFLLKTSQEHSVKPNVMDVHAYVIAFLLNFVTLQSPQPDGNNYPFYPYLGLCIYFWEKLTTIRYSQTPDEIQITCHVCIWNSFLLIYYTKICSWHYIICYPLYSLQTTQSRTVLGKKLTIASNQKYVLSI